MKSIVRSMLIVLAVMAFCSIYIYAVPPDPAGAQQINTTAVPRFNVSGFPPITIQAEAGNLTQLNIFALTQTQTWQGYFGNITGTIVLDDAYNFTMYSWDMAEPQGEIYAANKSYVNWSAVKCVNYSSNRTSGEINLSVLETMYGLSANDYDGVNETFNVNGTLSDGSTNHSGFYAGPTQIVAGTCPATDTYENDSSTGVNFQEVLLTDFDSIIFTTIIEIDDQDTELDTNGFNNQSWDFQMLVGDNGHNGNTDLTPYYFYVELQ